eukprot:TRINITY_DN232_c0_g1_i4.p1 TRINITY_DN232_c0_g1~~TRINITY_DN232_c0_g1_i4.p1  ORF type:complete len:399 (-),score=75.34 TRINITY_DN232_c0_g1_i4:127-1323(-)
MGKKTSVFFAGVLVALLIFFLVVAYVGSSSPSFEGWKVAKPNGPFWQIAMFLFMYSGLVMDVAFIRIAVVLANMFITAWVIFGVATWPNVWFSVLAEIHIDQLIWCFVCCFVNALPMFRQFWFDDSRVVFKVGKEYKECAEAVWREWWRRSGIPRSDFKAIVETGEFLTLNQGDVLQMTKEVAPSSDDENSDDGMNGHATEESYFYYIFDGSVLADPPPGSGRTPFILHPGCFWDAFELLEVMGQTSIALVMQTSFALSFTATVQERTIVIRWPKSAISGLNPGGFAPQCFRAIVSASTLDHLYRKVVSADSLKTFEKVDAKRRELAQSDLPKNAANVERSLWKQFWMSHFGWEDFWAPSPHQRVINAMQTGSREKTILKMAKEQKKMTQTMRQMVPQ